jgi:molybdate transport system permease protein
MGGGSESPLVFAAASLKGPLDEVAATFKAETGVELALPLAIPGVLAGAVLAFAKSLGEFGAPITFVSNIPGERQTIPSAIYAYTQTPGGERPAFRLTLVRSRSR